MSEMVDIPHMHAPDLMAVQTRTNAQVCMNRARVKPETHRLGQARATPGGSSWVIDQETTTIIAIMQQQAEINVERDCSYPDTAHSFVLIRLVLLFRSSI